MTRAERAAGARLGPHAAGAPTADAFAYQLEDRQQVAGSIPSFCCPVLLPHLTFLHTCAGEELMG